MTPAVVITRIADGPDGLRRLWGRRRESTDFASLVRVCHSRAALPAVIMALIFFGTPAAGTSVSAALLYGFVLQTAIVFITINLWEEVAVMGFLQAPLQDRHGPMIAVLLTTLIFTFQHITLIIASDSFALVLIFFLVTIFGFRALMGWIYNRTDNLFIMGLVHAAGNGATGGSAFFGSGMLGMLYASEDFATLLHLVAALIVGSASIAVTRGQLGKEKLLVADPRMSDSNREPSR